MPFAASDLDALRAYMPQVLEAYGVNPSRPFRCLNPEHADATPSATYYADGFAVHCFGCNRSWDVFSLVGMMEGLEAFPEQVRTVAAMVGYHLGEEAGQVMKPRHTRPAMPSQRPPEAAGRPIPLNACLAAHYRLGMPEGTPGRMWLRSRGFDDYDAIKYGLGWVKSPADFMPEFRVKEPNAAGFVVIPFYTIDTSVAEYAMLRTVADSPNVKEWRPAGIKSPLWREWMLSAGLPMVYVTEGLLDAMALEKITDRPTMALGGVPQAGRLLRVLAYTPEELRPGKVIICMDEDEAGRRTAQDLARGLDELGIRRGVFPPYPDGAKDADEWLMAGFGSSWYFEEEPATAADVPPLVRTRWVVDYVEHEG